MDKSEIVEKTEVQSAFRDGIAEVFVNDRQRHGHGIEGESQVGSFCPNCSAALEGRKCKLFCPTPGCGYLVTCSEW